MFICCLTACGRLGFELVLGDSEPSSVNLDGNAGQSSFTDVSPDSTAGYPTGGSGGTQDASTADTEDSSMAGTEDASTAGTEDSSMAGTEDASTAGTEDASTADTLDIPAPNEVCMLDCNNDHGSATCEDGVCVIICALGYGDCDDDAENGCETSLSDTVEDCGDCGLLCVNDHGSTACVDGICDPICDSVYGNCDGDASNGCETDLSVVDNCGACDVSCQNDHGTTSCADGVCTASCDPGYLDCDGDSNNGCETDVLNDPSHCGDCVTTCSGADLICVDGNCEVSSCDPGFMECDGDLDVACETDVTSSPTNCGFCGNICQVDNGSSDCVLSDCVVTGCNGDYDDCDGSATNGCEEDLATSTDHCGACFSPCANDYGTTSCESRSCVPVCSLGYGDCDGIPENGCESSLDTVDNCGFCDNVCPNDGGTAVCDGGVCGVLCDLTGTFAVKLTLQATWPDGSQIRSGSGTFTSWFRLNGVHSDNSVVGTMSNCGRDIPEFSSRLISETYKYGYANSLFDSDVLSDVAATVSLSDSGIGASLSLASTAFIMGTTLSDPINDSWPDTASGLTQVDHDGDGEPGVTAYYSDNGGYVFPRTSSSWFGYNRSDVPYVASRLVFSLNGTLDTCSASSGSADVTHVDTRIFACERANSSNPCDSDEANFLDVNCLNYNLGSASYSMTKVADTASCSDVRSALP